MGAAQAEREDLELVHPARGGAENGLWLVCFLDQNLPASRLEV